MLARRHQEAFARPTVFSVDLINTDRSDDGLVDPGSEGMTIRENAVLTILAGLVSNPNIVSRRDMELIAERTKGGQPIVDCANELANRVLDKLEE